MEESFRFLAAQGFERVQTEPSVVRYESGAAHINIYHGRKSFELGLEVGPLAGQIPVTSYSISEIIRLVMPGKADEYRNYAARNPEGVKEGVRRLALLFRQCVDLGVLKDEALFPRLDKQREDWKRELERDTNMIQARQKLDAAWRIKDYTQVVELLRPLRDALSPAEQHKLEYAERAIGSQQGEGP